MIQAYLNPKILTNDSEAHKMVMRNHRPELCSEGPARTGKTHRNLRKWLALHFMFKGLRSCIARRYSTDLTDTVRYDIREDLLRFPLDHPLSPVKQQGGLTRFDRLFINEGECRLGGIDRPSGILGSQYDLVLISELSEWDEEHYQMLKTRCSGSSAVWRDSNGYPLFQMLCDTNPDEMDNHFMYHREKQGLMEFVQFDFKDNPAFYRQNRWSKVGKTVVDELDRSLTGMYHDKYFKGMRVSKEGAVFNLKPCHLVDTLPWENNEKKLKDYNIYIGMDFGMAAPSTIIWLAQHKGTSDMLLYKEWRATNTDSIEIARLVKKHTTDLELKQLKTRIIDNDANVQSILRKHGVSTKLAKKGPDSIMMGLGLINHCLHLTEKGQQGGLKLYTGLRINSDPEIIRRKLAKDTIAEMKHLVYKDDKEKTEGDDHGVDPLRYILALIMVKPKIDLPAVLGTLDMKV